MLYLCHMNFEDRSTGWTHPLCQKEYVDAVHLRPCPTIHLWTSGTYYFTKRSGRPYTSYYLSLYHWPKNVNFTKIEEKCINFVETGGICMQYASLRWTSLIKFKLREIF